MADRRVLGVFAHPDDETFRCGGTLALLSRQGVEVHILTATRGGAGSCGDPPRCSREELPAMREQELRCACDALGIAPPHLLDYADGCLSEATEKLMEVVLEKVCHLRPEVILSFGPDGLSGHPDHITIGRCAMEAFDQIEHIAALYTLALPHSAAEQFGLQGVQPVPNETILLAVDVISLWANKLAAIQCHATQLSATPVMQASDEQRRAFFGTEYFIRAGVRSLERDILHRCLESRTVEL